MALFRHAIFSVGIALIAFAPMSAEAKCREVGRNIFHPPKGINAMKFRQTDNGRCSISYETLGNFTMTSARILEQPRHGKLTQDKPFGFLYLANKGWKGKNIFAVEVCGESMTAKGCSRLDYEMVTEPF